MSSQANLYPMSKVIIHKDTMLLIDEVVEYAENSLTAQLTITPQTEFLNADNVVPAWIGIEYMAQTIAAWAGVTHMNRGEELKKGYLLGSRKYISYVSHFTLGSVLNVSVEKVYEGDDLGVFDCTISNDQLLAEASLNVFQPQ